MSGMHRPLLFSFCERYLLLGVNLGSGIVLARLLTPAETGVYSVGSVLVGLAHVLRDFGIGQFVVQARELERATLRAALGVSYLLAAGLAAAVALASGELARFYHDPRVAVVLRLLAANMLLVPLTSMTLPVLRRQLRFGAVLAVNAASGVSAASVAVWLAWSGSGYASLAWGALAGSAAGALVSMWVRPALLPWWPTLRGSAAVLRFGAVSTAGTLIDEAGVAAPDLVIGRVLGMEAAGLAGKAQAAVGVFRTVVLAAVTPVLLPYFADQVRRHGHAAPAFVATVGNLCVCAWPFLAVVAVLAPELVAVLYGPQWQGAVPLIRIMCLTAALYSMGTVSRYLFVAAGQVGVQARIDCLGACARMAGVAAGVVAGLEGAAWGLVAAAVVRTWLMARALAGVSGIGIGACAAACRSGAALACGCALAVAASGQTVASPAARLLLGGGCAALAWLAGLRLLHHPLGAEVERVWRRARSLAGI